MVNSSYLLDSDEALEAMLTGLAGATATGWQPHRIIFRNFWFFSRDEFIWHGGRLFLGGQNAAGKSTVLSMAVPFLLDGNKGEERLNTFGGHGRSMAYYITGSASADDAGEAAYTFHARTSYLALEFRQVGADGTVQFITFGQGLQHDRTAEDRSVRSWGFVITDGRRIGRSRDGQRFDLLRDNLSLPTRGELRRLLGPGGEVFDTNLEYKRAVNRHLFGFADLDDFDALIDLLLQIRRPKLTKEAKPRDVVQILSESLPPLDAAQMQTTAQALDNIDQTTQNIELLHQQTAAVRELERRVQSVFRKAAEVAAADFRVVAREADADEAALAAKQAEFVAAHEALEEAEEQLAACARETASLVAERAQLERDNQDTLTAVRDSEEVRRELAEQQATERQVRDSLANLRRELDLMERKHRAHQEDWASERKAVSAFFDEAAGAADDARWATAAEWTVRGRSLFDPLKPGGEAVARQGLPLATIRVEVEERRTLLAGLVELAEAADQARAAWEQQRGQEDQARQRVFDADARAAQAGQGAIAAREAAIGAVDAWLNASPVVFSDGAARRAALDHLQNCTADTAGPGQVIAPLRPGIECTRREAGTAEADARRQLAEVDARLTDLAAAEVALKAAPPEPPRTAEQVAARAALTAAGIAWAPLYATLDVASDQRHHSDVTSNQRDQSVIEQALTEMGLLDAIVVAPADRPAALTALRAEGLSERFLLVPPTAPAPTSASLSDAGWQGIIPDADHQLAAHGHDVLRQIAVPAGPAPSGAPASVAALASLTTDATWRQGLLTGCTGPATAAKYIGRTARERNRQTELARVAAARTEAEALRALHQAALADAIRLLADLTAALSRLETLPELAALPGALVRLEQADANAAQERERAAAVTAATAAARRVWDEAAYAQLRAGEALPVARGVTSAGLKQMLTASVAVGEAFSDVDQRLRLLESVSHSIAAVASQIATQQGFLTDRENRADELAVVIRGLNGRLAAYERIRSAPDAAAVLRRVGELESALTALDATRRDWDRNQAVAEAAASRIDKELPALDGRARRSSEVETQARARLAEAVRAYPSLSQHQFDAAAVGRAREVADTLLSRYTDRTNLAQAIRNEEADVRAELSAQYNLNRGVLQPYYPELNAAECTARLVQFSVDGALRSPAELLAFLEKKDEELRFVLQEHEAELFERHLIRSVGDEIRRCLLRARDWVDDINRTLAAHPLRNDERLELHWEPKRSDHDAGGILARHIGLIRLSPANLTPEQRDVLMGAFRTEISIVRGQAKREEWRPDVFRERLTEVLDYRNWYEFRLFVTGGVTGRQEITDTYHNARSGSERSLVLLMPLLAALSVRYEAAAPHAPRLAALDEAFAGIDPVNSQQLLDFLAALNIAWIATSEKMPALSGAVSGASLYTMLRRGRTVTARAFIWDGQRLIAAEEDRAEREAAAADGGESR